MNAVTVRHRGGNRFGIQIREHEVTVDQPVPDAGTDAGPTPTELFVASLAYYARRYLARHGLPDQGLSVTAEYTMATRPARVGVVRIALHPPDDLPPERRDPLLAVASPHRRTSPSPSDTAAPLPR
jgi:uncharacterized OsmC-like protein